MNHNIVRELLKVSSGYVAGCALLEFIHTLEVPVIAFIQMLFYFFYYLVLSTLFDKIEASWHARREQIKLRYCGTQKNIKEKLNRTK